MRIISLKQSSFVSSVTKILSNRLSNVTLLALVVMNLPFVLTEVSSHPKSVPDKIRKVGPHGVV